MAWRPLSACWSGTGAAAGRPHEPLPRVPRRLPGAARVFGRETDVGIGRLLELAPVQGGGARLGSDARRDCSEDRVYRVERLRVARLSVGLVAESLTISGASARRGEHERARRG